MRQFIESTLVFQLVTTRFSPLNQKRKFKNQTIRYSVQVALFVALLAYQLYFFLSCKFHFFG